LDTFRNFFQMIVGFGFLAAMLLFVVVPVFRQILKGRSEESDEAHDPCKGCGYDARGLSRCPECGLITDQGRREALAKLRDSWPNEHISPRTPQPDEQPVVVLMTDNRWAADLLCQHLEARGIRATTSGGNALPGNVYTGTRESYRLSVWSDDEDRGKAIIERLWPADYMT
jgi:hypothetical protein